MTSTAALADPELERSVQRFYPDEIPPFPDEPMRHEFAIRRFGELGRGVCALRRFDPGALLFAFSGTIVTELTQYSLRLADNRHIHDPWFMGLVLHSCDPNACCEIESRTFTALRRVEPGDAITMDYEATEDVLFHAFRCRCGSGRCRGLIAGRKVLRA